MQPGVPGRAGIAIREPRLHLTPHRVDEARFQYVRKYCAKNDPSGSIAHLITHGDDQRRRSAGCNPHREPDGPFLARYFAR
jgi:hypothetical protein